MISNKKLKEGTNLRDMQSMNRSLVIRLLRNKQNCSRAKLAKETGLRQATITNIINDFINWGLVVETGIINGEKGRRSIGISLNNKKFRSIGVRLSRNYFSIGLFDLLGTGYSIKEEYIDASAGPDAALKKMKKTINEYIRKNLDKVRILGIGISIPGPYIKSKGRIALMTEFPGWDKILIEGELKLTSKIPIYFEHDANTGALAEWWYGYSRRAKGTLVYILAGEGIGAGIVIDGNLYRGSLGIAGEIGHTSINFNGPVCKCGNRGCLEHYCSTISLVNEAKKELPDYPKSVLNKDLSKSSIFSALKEGDELAEKLVNNATRYLGFGVVNVINTYNPDTIVIGDELTQAGAKVLEIVRNSVRMHTLPDIYKSLHIKLSSLKNDPVLLGASFLALENVLKNPSLFKELNNL